MTEQQIQSKIKKKMESDGWLGVKLIKTSLNGIPDLMFLKDGVTVFIEVKRVGGILSEIQKLRIEQLTSKGFEVKVWTDYNVEFVK